ncbi:PREDICTED: uncharacterized protein LOC109162622 [Ipomoea nil]|uniref:uncharacterized protein LOC109162622 n=1 Tax=Ipomoea nil TaxID=35883 RepID=UPI0009014A18|nr:PREDICTED: uncharacterized protein LOC109162622 [Ipomoea nil]
MSSNRHWMYTRMRNGLLTEEFLAGLETFIQFATSWMDGERIKCLCTQRKCQNTKFLDVPTVKYHLAKYGFVSDYYVWRFYGERIVRVDVDRDVGGPSQMASEEASNTYHTMVMDAVGLEFNVDEIEKSPNPEAQKFDDMLKAANQELWPGCKKHSQLSLVARLMSLKSENHISEKCFNQIVELMKEVVSENNLVPDNFYETKRLFRSMGLSIQKINRMSEVAGPGTECSRHTGGSRSEHYHKLEEIQTRHDAATQEVEWSTEPPIINMSHGYVDVVGGVKKQRIYGLGIKTSSFINKNKCSSSATSQLHQDAMKEMVNQQLETMRAEMEAKLQAGRTQMQAQIKAQFTSLMDELRPSLMDELRRNDMLSTPMPQPPTIQAEHSANSNAKNLGDD